MKIGIIDTKISKESATFFSNAFKHKLPLFDFLNSFFEFINYGYQIIDGKIDVTNIGKESNNSMVILYDFEDKVILNIGGMYQVSVEDITFEKIA